MATDRYRGLHAPLHAHLPADPETRGAPGRDGVTPAQLGGWRRQLGWSDGDGLDAASCALLLDEVERLRLLVRQAHRARAREGCGAEGAGALSSCTCAICAAGESEELVRAALHHPS